MFHPTKIRSCTESAKVVRWWVGACKAALCQRVRTMSTSLIYVAARSQPHVDAARRRIENLTGQSFTQYAVITSDDQRKSWPGASLLVTDNLTEQRRGDIASYKVPGTTIPHDEAQEVIRSLEVPKPPADRPCNDSTPRQADSVKTTLIETPPFVEERAMAGEERKDHITKLGNLADYKDNTNWDPHFSDEEVRERPWDQHAQKRQSRALDDYDRVDMKNVANWCPEQDHELACLSDQAPTLWVEAWIRSQAEESQIRLYDLVNWQLEPIPNVIRSSSFQTYGPSGALRC